MTLVAVWRNDDRLMAIADTRIIRGPGNVLTEHGPKILPLSVICREPGQSGFFDHEAYRSNIGFAYSGATLSALSTHALANTLLSNLVCNPGTPPPAMDQLALAIGGVSVEYMREVAQLAQQGGWFSALVFGYCHNTKRLRCFEIEPRLHGSTFDCTVSEHDFKQNNSIAIIGSCPALLHQKIEDDRAAVLARGDSNPVLDIDRPTRVLQTIINEGATDSVGGTIQQGWATAAGFEIAAKMMPITPRPPSTRNAGLFVLGFDIMDIQQIGAHKVSLGGR